MLSGMQLPINLRDYKSHPLNAALKYNSGHLWNELTKGENERFHDLGSQLLHAAISRNAAALPINPS
jgi:hypothetical protein